MLFIAAAYTTTQVIGVAIGGTGLGIVLHKAYRRLNGETYKPSREHEESLKTQNEKVAKGFKENKQATQKFSSDVNDSSTKIISSLSASAVSSEHLSQSTVQMTQTLGGLNNVTNSLCETHQEVSRSLPALVAVSGEIHQGNTALRELLNEHDVSINRDFAQSKTEIRDLTHALEQQAGKIEQLTTALNTVSAERDKLMEINAQLHLENSQLTTRLVQATQQGRFLENMAVTLRRRVATEPHLPTHESTAPSFH